MYEEWGERPRKSPYDPKYPVVKPLPSVSDNLNNMNAGDYARVASFTVGGYYIGYVIGFRPYTMRLPIARFTSLCCGIGALYASYLNSRQRLTGFFPNKAEYDAMMREKAAGES